MKTLFFLALFSACLNLNAQTSGNCSIDLISKTYDFGSDEIPHCVYKLRDGNIAIVGLTNKGSIGGDDIFLTKIKADGSLIWTKYYGTPLNELGYPLGVVDDDEYNLYLYGVCNTPNPNTSYLSKLDSSGNVLFSSSTINNSIGDYNRHAKLLSNGNTVFVGTSDITSNQAAKIFVADKNGTILWTHTFDHNGSTEHFIDIEELDDKLYVAGHTSNGSSGYGSFLVKMDLSGNTVWQKYIDYNNTDGIRHEELTHKETIITVSTISTSGASAFGQEDVGIFNIDTNGNSVWSKIIGKAGIDHATGLLRLNNFYYVSGTTTSFDGAKSKLFLIKLDIDGNIVWSKLYGAAGEIITTYGFSNALTAGPDGSIILVGQKKNTTEDIILYKIDECGNSNCPAQDIVFSVKNENPVVSNSSLTDLGLLPTKSLANTLKKSLSNTVSDKCPPLIACDLHAGFRYTFKCLNDSVHFFDSSYSISGKKTDQYKWIFHDNTVSSKKDVAYKYSSTGIYKVTLIVYSGICTDTLIKFISVTNKIYAKISADTNSICKGDSVRIRLLQVCGTPGFTIQWFPQAYTSDSNGLSIIASPPNSMWIRYVLKDANSGELTDSVFIIVRQNCCSYTAAVKADKQQYCINEKAGITSLIKTPGASYKWYIYFNNILIDSSSNADLSGFPLNKTGIYRFRLRVSGSCKPSSAEDTVSVYPLPLAFAGKDTLLCAPSAISIGDTAIAQHSYLWTPSSGLSSSNQSRVLASVTKSVSYYLRVKNLQTLCENTDSVSIELFNDSGWGFAGDTSLCEGQSMMLSAGNNQYKYLWNDGSTKAEKNITGPGTYVVGRTSVCGTSSDTITVFSKQCFCELFIPNAMSPDANAINDYFPEQYLDTIVSLEIYNRWGEKLCDKQDTRLGWDGYYMGEIVQQDVYLYIIRYKNCRGYYIYKSGTFTVIR